MKESEPGLVSWALVLALFLILASFVLTMVLGPVLLFFTHAGLDVSKTLVRPPVLILMFEFTTPLELSAGQLFIFLWCFFALCFAISWRVRKSLHGVVRKIFSQPFRKIFDNWLLTMPIIASALYVAVIGIVSLQDLFNVPTGSIPNPTSDTGVFTLYLNLSYAPLIEEIGFRIIPIGLALLVLLFLKRSTNRVDLSSWQRFKVLVFSFLYPEGAKNIVGAKTVAANGLEGISKGEWSIILITSLLFGVAHITSGIGWEIGKLTSTFVQGFVLAIVYVAYGFQAPILLHWFFNYYFYTYQVSGNYYPYTIGVFAWTDFITLTLGAASLIGFALLGLEKISNRRRTEQQSSSEIPL